MGTKHGIRDDTNGPLRREIGTIIRKEKNIGTNIRPRKRENGIRDQSGGPQASVWTRNGHQHRSAGVRRGKNQSAKELADSARRLASRAYHSNDYASQEKVALHAFQTAVGEDLQLKCAERSCLTLEMAVETVEIQERYTKKAVRALKQEESDMALQLKTMGEKLETLMGEIKDDREQRKQWAARRESGRRRKADMECHSCHQEGMPDQHGRTLGKRTVAAVEDRKWPLPPWTDRGKRGQFPGRYGIRGVHPGGTHMEEMGPHGERADKILGAAVFGGRTSAGVSGRRHKQARE